MKFLFFIFLVYCLFCINFVGTSGRTNTINCVTITTDHLLQLKNKNYVQSLTVNDLINIYNKGHLIYLIALLLTPNQISELPIELIEALQTFNFKYDFNNVTIEQVITWIRHSQLDNKIKKKIYQSLTPKHISELPIDIIKRLTPNNFNSVSRFTFDQAISWIKRDKLSPKIKIKIQPIIELVVGKDMTKAIIYVNSSDYRVIINEIYNELISHDMIKYANASQLRVNEINRLTPYILENLTIDNFDSLMDIPVNKVGDQQIIAWLSVMDSGLRLEINQLENCETLPPLNPDNTHMRAEVYNHLLDLIMDRLLCDVSE